MSTQCGRGGLYLEVTQTGAKLWRWQYRYAGKEKRLALGHYPRVSSASARKGSDAAREMLAGGMDPTQARRDARQAVMMEAETLPGSDGPRRCAVTRRGLDSPARLTLYGDAAGTSIHFIVRTAKARL